MAHISPIKGTRRVLVKTKPKAWTLKLGSRQNACLARESMWVVVKIMAPFWVPIGFIGVYWVYRDYRV